MISWLFKPRPYPAFGLFALVLIIAAFKVPRVMGIAFFIVAALLLNSLIRSVIVDLSIGRDGLTTFGRVTKIEKKYYEKKKERWWDVDFTFTDASGVVHNQSIEIWDAREAHNLAEGSAVKIRYHPKFPDDSYRWLGPATDATEDPESKSPDSDAT